MGGTHFLQTGYLLLNRNAPYSCYFPCFLRLTCTVAIQNLHAQNRIFDAFRLALNSNKKRRYTS